MEQSLLEKLQLHLSDPSRGLRSLATARSLITNPSSSSTTRRAVADLLLYSLNHHSDPTFIRSAIKLLADVSVLHPPLAPSLLAALRPLLASPSNRLAADALAALSTAVGANLLDEDLILSLAASPVVSVRSQLLNLLLSNSTLLRPDLMLSVFFGLTDDLYPSVRKAALEGLLALCKDADSAIAGYFYDHAVMLLWDEEECVRLGAVRLVSECGQIFALDEEGTDKSERMDAIFIQLCSMTRDTSMKVRIEAFTALGKVRLVSESVLVKSLSKKASWVKNEESALAKCSLQESKLMLPCAAGAFVHGVEDEFHEVRTAACKSLGMLATFSIKFAVGGLNLLIDLLNDDTTPVRLQTLQTLFHMAASDRLTMQEEHLHMFLSLLADITALIRSAARKVLRLMRLPEMKIFKIAINALVTNMETYPEEEKDIFSVLFFIGKNHGKFAAKLAERFIKKLKLSDGELSLDSSRVAAFLVLALSSPFSDKQLVCDISSSVFSYAVPLLGRISCSLGNIIDQDSLLTYLCYHSGTFLSARTSYSREAELLPLTDEEVISNYSKWPDKMCCSSWLTHKETPEIKFKNNIFDRSERSIPLEEIQQKRDLLDEEIRLSIKLILKTVAGTWHSIQSNCILGVQKTLRTCMEELEMIACDADGSVSSVLSFALKYVLVIQLFAEIWEQVKPKRFRTVGMVSLDILLEKLEMSLRQMRYGFLGLSKEEECHILELTLFGYVLRMHKTGTCSEHILKIVLGIISRLEHLCEEDSLSNFSKELYKICNEEKMSGIAHCFPVHKLLDLFYLEQIQLNGRLGQIKADLQAIGNDSDNPLPFVSGLPVGITFQVTLYNISDSNRLWVRMAVLESVQYVFLELCQFGGSDQVRKCTITLPFYTTPRATSFILRSCICMECPPEGGTCLKKTQKSPRHDILPLGKENQIYLVKIEDG